ncbi:hypothetical protein BpHYR1_007378 [Brachionus plicatilis]|uniref:Uncharacterized protein n=1 Tax=Brachionus plicatilis TaxID=10195 RepID=A0A3M7P2B2_BRAPC|nr:hypothetical protein BpHYR1_007378 [Brachionus plicatilis]
MHHFVIKDLTIFDCYIRSKFRQEKAPKNYSDRCLLDKNTDKWEKEFCQSILIVFRSRNQELDLFLSIFFNNEIKDNT